MKKSILFTLLMATMHSGVSTMAVAASAEPIVPVDVLSLNFGKADEGITSGYGLYTRKDLQAELAEKCPRGVVSKDVIETTDIRDIFNSAIHDSFERNKKTWLVLDMNNTLIRNTNPAVLRGAFAVKYRAVLNELLAQLDGLPNAAKRKAAAWNYAYQHGKHELTDENLPYYMDNAERDNVSILFITNSLPELPIDGKTQADLREECLEDLELDPNPPVGLPSEFKITAAGAPVHGHAIYRDGVIYTAGISTEGPVTNVEFVRYLMDLLPESQKPHVVHMVDDVPHCASMNALVADKILGDVEFHSHLYSNDVVTADHGVTEDEFRAAWAPAIQRAKALPDSEFESVA